jgi:chitodextrinase
MLTIRALPRMASLLIAVLVASSVLTLIPSPAGAVQAPQSFVVNPDPVDWTPNVLDGQVNAILQMGNKVVVGGTFTQVRRPGFSEILPRNFLFAFDMGTGVIDPNFVPVLDAAVEELAPGPDGTSVFVGGDFGTVNGLSYKKLVRLNLSNGSVVTSFKANANRLVQDIVMRNGWLYVSGKFDQIKSTARSGVARLNPATGAVDPNFDLPFTNPLRGTLGVPRIDVSPDGSKLVAIGSFSQVAGLPRVQVAMLDLTTIPASVSSWQTSLFPVYEANGTTTWCSSSFATYMRDIDISPDGSYFVVVTTGAFRANRLCDTVDRFELSATGPGQAPTWSNWTGGDTSWSVSISGTAVYVGGHMRWMNNPYRGDVAGPGAVPREGIAALSPENGIPFSWNPGHERGVGSFTLPVTPDGMWVGSDTDRAGNEFHQKIAFFPAEGGLTPPPVVTYSLPNDLYNMDQAGVGALNRRSYDLTAFGPTSTVPLGIDWRNARGAFMLNGNLYYGMNDGWLYKRTFDGTTLGAATQLNLYGLEVQPSTSFVIPGTTTRLPAFTTDIASMTGMFYDNYRIYYTVAKTGTASANNNKLYYRYYNPESDIVGANLFVASTGGEGINWGNVRGMTLASGKLIFALTDGRLYSVNWGGAKPTGAITQISSATTWQSRGMFVYKQLADSFAPSTPGKPIGTSSTFDSIDLNWQASTDNAPGALTYRVYRDGGLVDQVVSSSTGTISYSDTGLAAGATHTYQVDAIDAANNASAMSDSSDPITVLAPDTTPPTDPGTPTGVGVSTSRIELSWPASSDAETTNLTYRVFRDDPGNEIAQFQSSSTTTVSFTDTGLWPGSTHTYWVEAMDAAMNTSARVPSEPITVMEAVFADDFSAGLTNWTTVTRIFQDIAIGSQAAPSAQGNPAAQSAFAYRDLGTTLNMACVSANINVSNRTAGVGLDLFRLRTAANGAISKVALDTQGRLIVRSDFAGTQINSLIALQAGWNRIELCGSDVSSGGVWDLYLNGTKIVDAWAADTGTEPVGRIQIGDTADKTWTANFDEVQVDQFVGEGGGSSDTQGPTAPGQPTGSSPSAGAIQIAWAASTDASPPITYRIYRDADPIPVGETTATMFMDTGLTPGASHTYTVDAVDSLDNPSLMSPASASILVSGGATPPIFEDDFSSFASWVSVTRLTIDNTVGSPAAPSARAQVTSQSAFAYRDLGTTTMTPCLSVNVNLSSGTGVDLFRLRTAGNGAVVKVFVHTTGTLQIRSDFDGTTRNSGIQVGTGWHTIELCGTVGSNTTWDLFRDGTQIVTDWQADSGTTPVGRIQIGDTAAKTWTANFDDVIVDGDAG